MLTAVDVKHLPGHDVVAEEVQDSLANAMVNPVFLVILGGFTGRFVAPSATARR